MGSQEQWPAARVRETFLEYFKQNGHTFGMATVRIDIDIAANMSHSTFILRRTACRSNVTFCECWNEPV